MENLNEEVVFEDWVVCENGDMINAKNHNYKIPGDRLHESKWISHMNEKSWIDMNTFIDAYFYALRKYRMLEELTVKVY